MAQQFNQYSFEARELGFNIVAASGTPGALVAKKGTLYVDTSATTTTTRLWINTDGSSTWAYFTASA